MPLASSIRVGTAGRVGRVRPRVRAKVQVRSSSARTYIGNINADTSTPTVDRPAGTAVGDLVVVAVFPAQANHPTTVLTPDGFTAHPPAGSTGSRTLALFSRKMTTQADVDALAGGIICRAAAAATRLVLAAVALRSADSIVSVGAPTWTSSSNSGAAFGVPGSGDFMLYAVGTNAASVTDAGAVMSPTGGGTKVLQARTPSAASGTVSDSILGLFASGTGASFSAPVANTMSIGVGVKVTAVVPPFDQTPTGPAQPAPEDGMAWSMAAPDGATTDKVVAGHSFTPYVPNTSSATAQNRDSDAYANTYLAMTGTYANSLGWHETRPFFYGPNGSSSVFVENNYLRQIEQHHQHGVRLHVVDLLGRSGPNYNNAQAQTRACARFNADHPTDKFYIAPMLDGNGAHSRTGAGTAQDPYVVVDPLASAASIVEVYWGKSSTFMLNGKFAIFSFKGEERDATWWSQLKAEVERLTGVQVTLQLGFLTWGARTSYTAITDGWGYWGDGDDPATITAASDKTAVARAAGKEMMLPVGGGQIRRSSGLFDETCGLLGLIEGWNKVLRENPRMVQLVTLDDYSEGATHAVSEVAGYTRLIVDAWFIYRFLWGVYPTIQRDEVIVSHRQSARNGSPTQSKPLVQWKTNSSGRGGPFSAEQNIVEVLTWLTAPAQITVTIGGIDRSYQAPAGFNRQTYAAAPGLVTARTSRGGELTMFDPITDTPPRQNAIYGSASMLRGTTGQRFAHR